jgi:hypothetical protein
MDHKVGGLMWYERASFGGVRGLKYTKRTVLEYEGDEYRDEEPAEWVRSEELGFVGPVGVSDVGMGRRGLGLGEWLI